MHHGLIENALARLNDELLDAGLSESQFAAAVYALIDIRTRRVQLTRGGAPYPILRRADGRCRLLHPAGPLIGVVPGAEFALESFELAAGESLLLYSDGVERVLQPGAAGGDDSATIRAEREADPDHHADPDRDTVAPDQAITTTDWFATLSTEGVPAALEQITARHDTLRRLGQPLDDLTVLAINIDR